MVHIILYISVWADYVAFSISLLNFKLTWLVSLCIAAAFWLEKDEFDYA